MSRHRCLPGGENDGQDGGWSQVNNGWHGDPPPAGWADHDLNFENSTWQSASDFGLDGVGPLGDDNHEMATDCDICSPGSACTLPGDCSSGQCEGGKCTSCTNELTDGLETGVDCGGATCEKRCGLDSPCAADGDCATRKCDGEMLRCRALNSAELCTDGAQANMESDVDCGGAVCAPIGRTCAVGFTCALDSDCTSAVCD